MNDRSNRATDAIMGLDSAEAIGVGKRRNFSLTQPRTMTAHHLHNCVDLGAEH